MKIIVQIAQTALGAFRPPREERSTDGDITFSANTLCRPVHIEMQNGSDYNI